MTLNEISDYKAESGVISTLIYHPEFIYHSPTLSERYFYCEDNQCMFWAIRHLVENKITTITALNLDQIINENLTVAKKMKEFNYPSYQEYIDTCYTTKRDTVEEYLLLVDRVVSLAFKRHLYKKAGEWQKKCTDNSVELDMLSNKVYQDLEDLTTKFVTDGKVKMIGEMVDELWGKIEDRKIKGESYGLTSVFPSLKKYFQYEKTELVVVEARMKKGKSWLAMIEAIHKAKQGVCTLVYDSEMSDDNWYVRAISYLSGISADKIKNDILTEEELYAVQSANEELKTLPIYHIFDPYMKKEKFYAICAQKKVENDLQFVVWDYIKCDDSILNSAERSAYMGGITNWLKNVIAGDLNLAVLAFVQLNRNNEVAESDGVEKYCSVAVKWAEKDEEEIQRDGAECGTHKLTVKLNRLGRQAASQDEYLDMMFRQDRVGIVEAIPHQSRNPFD